MNTKLKKNKKGNKKETEKVSEEPKQNEQLSECFICLENYCDNEISIKLNENPYYPKNCDCNVWVHSFCLDKWYSTSSYNCPICKKHIFTPINQAPINQALIIQRPVNQNVKVITNFDKILIILLLFSYLYLYKTEQKKETGYAY
jgi:hypothetical protein